jgi:hypothetical protein
VRATRAGEVGGPAGPVRAALRPAPRVSHLALALSPRSIRHQQRSQSVWAHAPRLRGALQ